MKESRFAYRLLIILEVVIYALNIVLNGLGMMSVGETAI